MTNDDAVVRIGALELKFLLDETQGAGDLVMFEFLIPPSARVPQAHYHKDVDEVVYGLEGTTTSTVDGEKHEIKRGDSLFIGRGRVHIHENLSDAPVRVLAVLNPGSIGRHYFEEVAEVVNGPGKPDPEKMKEIMLRYGLVPA
jgi:quercetin dioxygenase-like cupin family protein